MSAKRRPTALTKARGWGFEVVNDVVEEIVELDGIAHAVHELTELHVKEQGEQPPCDTALYEFAEGLSNEDQRKTLLKLVTTYSDGQTFWAAAQQEIALAMGVSLGLALTGRDGVR